MQSFKLFNEGLIFEIMSIQLQVITSFRCNMLCLQAQTFSSCFQKFLLFHAISLQLWCKKRAFVTFTAKVKGMAFKKLSWRLRPQTSLFPHYSKSSYHAHPVGNTISSHPQGYPFATDLVISCSGSAGPRSRGGMCPLENEVFECETEKSIF